MQLHLHLTASTDAKAVQGVIQQNYGNITDSVEAVRDREMERESLAEKKVADHSNENSS